ncbi:glycosyltransferase [Janibacter sp. DB-40]|uniref:glycosyltransferase n=1 Tax=Janibacter sp. DB-40 TaxID=3028808 RepID=UPI002406A0B2|nr:glycosyltransferase [Janibacter sp. DB-40]
MTEPREATSIWVVLPTYNGGVHLREQLQSIARQERPPDGLVASDDGSSDDSVSILEAFARSAPFPVTVLRQPHNVGLLSNLETALATALTTADVIAFADQDDLWHPAKLARIEQAFADPCVLMWFSDAEFIDAGGRPYGVSLWQALSLSAGMDLNAPQHLLRFITGQTIIGTAMAARSSLVRAGVPFPRTAELDSTHHFLHDGWLGLLAHLRGGVLLEPQAMTQYRQHDQQFTGMSLLRSAVEVAERHRSLNATVVLEEELRLSAIEQHLRRPHSMSFLGGAVPAVLLDRIEYTSTRASVVTGHQNPLRLLTLRHHYDAYADGWKTLLVDIFRYMRGRVRRGLNKPTR